MMVSNLPLAGRCAAQPEVKVSDALRDQLRWALVHAPRTQMPICGRVLLLVWPLANWAIHVSRLARGRLASLLPPLIEIPGGTYRIGSDEGLYEDEAPVHAVEVAPFAIGQFPVTNAEWALFMQAGGYEDERWWDTDAAKAWQRGESTAEGPKQQWRENGKTTESIPIDSSIAPKTASHRNKPRTGNSRPHECRRLRSVAKRVVSGGRQTQPAYWNDDAFNNPAQPVVGICWFEARAYCAWLSTQTGQTFRLPTEAEWEAAAAGCTGSSLRLW